MKEPNLVGAVLSRAVGRVQDLLRAGADPNECDADGTPALHYAVHSQSFEIINELLVRGADVDQQARDGGTALLIAAGAGDKSIVEALLASGANPKASYTDRDTVNAVMVAAKRGHGPIIETLLRGGAEVTYKSALGVTALHFAVIEADRPDVVALLIALGADPHAQTVLGKTPMDYAKSLRRDRCVEFLSKFDGKTLSVRS